MVSVIFNMEFDVANDNNYLLQTFEKYGEIKCKNVNLAFTKL